MRSAAELATKHCGLRVFFRVAVQLFGQLHPRRIPALACELAFAQVVQVGVLQRAVCAVGETVLFAGLDGALEIRLGEWVGEVPDCIHCCAFRCYEPFEIGPS